MIKCVELAKTPRAPVPNKGKGKSGTKTPVGEGSVVYDYHEGSVCDFALRAQVLQGYEEFKVRADLCRPFLFARQRRQGPFIYQLFFRHRCSLPMGRSRPSLARWDGRRWSFSWRGSSRCGRGNWISRRIRNLGTVSVRPSHQPPFFRWPFCLD